MWRPAVMLPVANVSACASTVKSCPTSIAPVPNVAVRASTVMSASVVMLPVPVTIVLAVNVRFSASSMAAPSATTTRSAITVTSSRKLPAAVASATSPSNATVPAVAVTVRFRPAASGLTVSMKLTPPVTESMATFAASTVNASRTVTSPSAVRLAASVNAETPDKSIASPLVMPPLMSSVSARTSAVPFTVSSVASASTVTLSAVTVRSPVASTGSAAPALSPNTTAPSFASIVVLPRVLLVARTLINSLAPSGSSAVKVT